MPPFQNICSLPLPAELFTQALHPSLPLLSIGLSTGHVHTYRLPPIGDSPSDSASPPPPQPFSQSDDSTTKPILRRTSTSSLASENGLGSVETAWRTKRHKGSCRTLAFSPDGSTLYSAGTDGIVKAAAADTGQVTSKIAIPRADGQPDLPTLLHALNEQTLLLATDSSALHVYDLRSSKSALRPSATYNPHSDYISSLTPLAPVSSTSNHSVNANASSAVTAKTNQFLTTGSTTLGLTDLRKGVLVQSSDQDDELTSSVCVRGLSSRGSSVGEKVLVGGAEGVVSLWERGVWDDLDERVVVDEGGSEVEVLVNVPESLGGEGGGKLVAAGLGDGRVRFVRIGGRKGNGVVREWDVRHDEVEGVAGVGFDVGGRMVSGGGMAINVWRVDEEEEEEDDDEDEREVGVNGSGLKRSADSDEDDEWSDVVDSEEEENKKKRSEKKNRKKRKRGKKKDRSGGGDGQVSMAFKGMT
ncbi:MAG: hypothetical protein Q9227_000653 [Pyrenula ochraceoflavens]